MDKPQQPWEDVLSLSPTCGQGTRLGSGGVSWMLMEPKVPIWGLRQPQVILRFCWGAVFSRDCKTLVSW